MQPSLQASLQAWDSADQLLLDELSQNIQAQAPAHPLLILNDSFGALNLTLSKRFGSSAGASFTDSYVSKAGCEANAKHNNVAIMPVQPLTEPMPAAATVVLKLPKSNSLLRYQLERVAQAAAPNAQFFVAAKSKLFTPATRALFAEYLDDMKVSLIHKKARVLTGQLKPASARENIAPETEIIWPLPETALHIHHLPGIFARNQLDIGTRLLLDNLPAAGAQQVIDLGCGNGVLGAAYALKSPTSAITWVDESYLSIASVERTLQANASVLTNHDGYTTEVDDCLTGLPAQSADLILCNPPFHQEFAITEHIALQMFQDAKRVLRPGGELRIVGNRHLNYHQHLKRIFGHCNLVASDAKFVILSVKTDE